MAPILLSLFTKTLETSKSGVDYPQQPGKPAPAEDLQVMLDYVTCYRRVAHSGLSELLTHTIVTNGQMMVVLSH